MKLTPARAEAIVQCQNFPRQHRRDGSSSPLLVSGIEPCVGGSWRPLKEDTQPDVLTSVQLYYNELCLALSVRIVSPSATLFFLCQEMDNIYVRPQRH